MNERQLTDSAVDDVNAMLGALNDADCRRILATTQTEPMCVAELSKRCSIPLSTAYRKVDDLSVRGLLDEHVLLQSNGKHVSMYEASISGVSISIADDGLEIEVVNSKPSNWSDEIALGANVS